MEVISSGFDVPSGKDNVAYTVVSEAIRRYGISKIDLRVEVIKGVPPGYGLGSSGATSAAVAYGLSRVLNLDLSDCELLRLAASGEAAVSGSPHYDNVAASLHGGIVFIDVAGLEVYKYTPTFPIYISIVMPATHGYEKSGKTKFARSILPKELPLDTYVKQSSALAQLVYALMTNNIRLLGKAVSTDYLSEPYRSKFISFYDDLKRLALQNDARGFNIAGAGPSVFAISESRDKAEEIANMLKSYLESRGVESRALVTTVSREGASVKSPTL